MVHRRRRKTKVQRVVIFIKSIIAFFFSHVGLCAVVIGYALLGAVTFKAIESEHEHNVQRRVYDHRYQRVNVIWNTTYRINILNELAWKETVKQEIETFQAGLMIAIRDGYDGKEYNVVSQWTFTGAFLFSLTVITTIGYGNTACKTYFGKTVTMVYAIIGIPLLLLFLTNIGDVLAKTFKWLYSRSVKLKMRIVLWQKRRKQAKLRHATNLVTRMSRNNAPPNNSSRHPNNNMHDPQQQAYFSTVPDFEELIAAREELAKLEAKLQVEEQLQNVTVPLSLVMFTMIGYLVFGSVLFSWWEKWTVIEGFYFCWVSLATIGFGDLFPGTSVGGDSAAQEKLIITSVYLMFGMALIAMCLNLVQEEVVNKISWLLNKLGVVKEHDEQSQQEND